MKYTTREAWLEAAVEITKPLFENAGYKVPKVRVACGWPSRGGLSVKKKTIGQCWDAAASTDKVHQIFISPWLINPADEYGVLPVLIHEIAHAVVGIDQKHNKVFGKCARAVGLEGKLTATVGGEELIKKCIAYVKQLGEYPHAQLDPKKSPVKKQSTRLMKCECSECGYICRTTKKWLEISGAPICPVSKHGVMSWQEPEENEGNE
jgi:hypothetical protein